MMPTLPEWLVRAVGACGLLALTGCEFPEPPAASLQRPEARIAEVELAHTVYFATDDAELTPGEAEALRRFARLAREQLVLRKVVIGHADVRAGDAYNDALSARRAETVAVMLAAEGMVEPGQMSLHALGRRVPVEAAEEETSWRLSRRVEVLASGAVIIEPACPDWSRASASHPSNLSTSNLGCATELNLVRMLAEPADLISGAGLGPADGIREAGAVERYRRDEVRPLKLEQTGR